MNKITHNSMRRQGWPGTGLTSRRADFYSFV